MSVKGTLRRTWPVLVAYAVFSIWGLVCLIASIALTSGIGGGTDAVALLGIIVATAVGHVAGNALGLVRFRLAVIVVGFTVLFIGGTFLAATLGPVGAYFIIAMVAALSGYLGVASRLDVVAAWFPLSLAVGAAIIWMNRHGAVSTFNGGNKHAIWDPFTLVCLTGTVFLMLVFLATRNSLGLTAWQEVGRRGKQLGDGPNETEEQVTVARPGRGSLFVLFVFTLVVLGATAAVSPYLFRTAEDPNAKDGTAQSDKGDHQGDKAEQGEGKGKGKGKGKGHGKGSGKGKGKGQGKGQGKGHGKGKARGHGSGHGDGSGQGQGDGEDGNDGEDSNEPDTEHASEAASEALQLGAKILMWLLAAAAILLVLTMLVFPPIRRAVLLRHLDKPMWPVPPTARVMNLWRLARATLADLGIEPELGETPSDFAKRAKRAVGDELNCDTPGLVDAAAIVEKIDYAGRGLAAEDAQAMRSAVSAFVAEVSPRIGFGRKFKRAWGRPPEVES